MTTPIAPRKIADLEYLIAKYGIDDIHTSIDIYNNTPLTMADAIAIENYLYGWKEYFSELNHQEKMAAIAR